MGFQPQTLRLGSIRAAYLESALPACYSLLLLIRSIVHPSASAVSRHELECVINRACATLNVPSVPAPLPFLTSPVRHNNLGRHI